MVLRIGTGVAVAALVMAGPAVAQKFTTAAEVKPIMEQTKANWAVIKEFPEDGFEMLYLTHVASWRCGMTSVSYAINGGDLTELPLEECHESTVSPNAMVDNDFIPAIRLPMGTVQQIVISIVYDDGTIDGHMLERGNIMLP